MQSQTGGQTNLSDSDSKIEKVITFETQDVLKFVQLSGCKQHGPWTFLQLC